MLDIYLNKNKCLLITSELAGSDYSVHKRSRGKDYTDYTGARKFSKKFFKNTRVETKNFMFKFFCEN